MKTPITYYGGKQTLLKYILPLIPPHQLYCEPFFGGGAVLFAKPKSETEVVNDTNGELVNFFQVVKKQFPELQKEIQATPHSRELYKKAMEIYKNPEKYSGVKRAWALWTATNQGFAGMIGSWGFGKDHSKEASLYTKRENFVKEYAERLAKVQLEHNDAIKVITRCDDKNAFVYCDPPYIGSDMGHYSGYTEKQYQLLLDVLVKFKGKFLLSSYPSNILTAYIKKHKWKVQKIIKSVAVTKHTDKKKTELLVMNYNPSITKQITPTSSDKNSSIKKIESQLHRLKFKV
jgi:DNA adenine methylase